MIWQCAKSAVSRPPSIFKADVAICSGARQHRGLIYVSSRCGAHRRTVQPAGSLLRMRKIATASCTATSITNAMSIPFHYASALNAILADHINLEKLRGMFSLPCFRRNCREHRIARFHQPAAQRYAVADDPASAPPAHAPARNPTSAPRYLQRVGDTIRRYQRFLRGDACNDISAICHPEQRYSTHGQSAERA